MVEFVRTLTFRTHDLGVDATLVFTFNDDNIPGIYENVFPTAFIVTEFGKTGTTLGLVQSLNKHFDDVQGAKRQRYLRFGFTRVQNNDITRPASAYSKPIDAGQETSLTREGNLYMFTDPKDLKPPTKQIAAKNDTPGKENLGFGFFLDPQKPPTTILLFEHVGSESTAQIQFTPILRVYVTTDHNWREGQVIRSRVSSPIILSVDLTQLEEETKWKVTYNAGTGKFEIKQET